MKKKIVVQNYFQGFEEDSDNKEDCQPIVTKIEEMKNSYNYILFQEEGINITEMKYNAKWNKLLDKKNCAIENANTFNTYYNSVITLQKEEINKLITEVEELQRSKILKENKSPLHEVK